MLEQLGRDHGSRDGELDARTQKPKRSRPDLLMSLLSTGYRDGYLKSYRESYFKTKHEIELQKGKQKGPCKAADQAFDKGWQDGYLGKPETPASRDEAYQRGYQIGLRDRDYSRAKTLRAQVQQTHER